MRLFTFSSSATRYLAPLAAAAALFGIWKAFEDRFNQPAVIDQASVARYSSAEASLGYPIRLGSLDQGIDPDFRRTDVSFDFRLNRPTNDNDGFTYPNLFQTSAINQGIRLEFAISRRSGVAWGLAIADAGGGTVSVPLPEFPEFDRWYKFRVQVEPTSVTAYLDGGLLFRSGKVRLKYKMDDVTVGAGFSNSRVFVGRVRDFQITTFDASAGRAFFGKIFSVILPFGIFFILFGLLFSKDTSRKNGAPSRWLSLGIVLLLVGMLLCLFFRAKIIPNDTPGSAGAALLFIATSVPLSFAGGVLSRGRRTSVRASRTLIVGAIALATLGLSLTGLYCGKVGLSSKSRTSLLNFDEVGAIFQSNPIVSGQLKPAR